jgi:RimJ/RimL family protein N-acetyltransferase
VKAPLVVTTPRLILSPPEDADASEIFTRYAGDPDVTKFLGWARHRSVADTRTFLAWSAQEWKRWPAGPYLIRARDDGRLLGSTGLAFESPDRAATGYVLAKDGWGHGYASEALRAMIGVARQTGVEQLYALCHPEHRASSHVLEKCGFAPDPTWFRPAEFPNVAPGVLQSVACYTLDLTSGPEH